MRAIDAALKTRKNNSIKRRKGRKNDTAYSLKRCYIDEFFSSVREGGRTRAAHARKNDRIREMVCVEKERGRGTDIFLTYRHRELTG